MTWQEELAVKADALNSRIMAARMQGGPKNEILIENLLEQVEELNREARERNAVNQTRHVGTMEK